MDAVNHGVTSRAEALFELVIESEDQPSKLSEALEKGQWHNWQVDPFIGRQSNRPNSSRDHRQAAGGQIIADFPRFRVARTSGLWSLQIQGLGRPGI